MKLNSEVVKFRDGTKLTVTEANWAITMKLQELEEQANQHVPEDIHLQSLNTLYPRLAACSSGKVPTFQETADMPSRQVDVWFFAVRRINPDWFAPVDGEAEGEASLEKKEKKPIESSLD